MFEYPMNTPQMPYQPSQTPFGMGGMNNMQQNLSGLNRPQASYQPTQYQAPRNYNYPMNNYQPTQQPIYNPPEPIQQIPNYITREELYQILDGYVTKPIKKAQTKQEGENK